MPPLMNQAQAQQAVRPLVDPRLQDLLFFYFISVTLTALASGSGNVQTDNDADFEWRWLISSQTGTYSVQLTDRFTARPMSNGKVNNENLAGTAQLPFILPKPYLIRRTSSIQGDFTDRSNAGNTIQLCFAGYKLAQNVFA